MELLERIRNFEVRGKAQRLIRNRSETEEVLKQVKSPPSHHPHQNDREYSSPNVEHESSCVNLLKIDCNHIVNFFMLGFLEIILTVNKIKEYFKKARKYELR